MNIKSEVIKLFVSITTLLCVIALIIGYLTGHAVGTNSTVDNTPAIKIRSANHYDYEAFKHCEAGLFDQHYRCIDYVVAHMVEMTY